MVDPSDANCFGVSAGTTTEEAMVGLPIPRLRADSPIGVIETRTLFPSTVARHRNFGSLVRLHSGRLLLAFRLGVGPDRRNDGAVMLSSSDDGGRSWDEPVPVYAHPGWDGLLMGGLARLADDHIQLVLGRIRLDFELGGDEPASDWYVAVTSSRDGGRTWSELGPEIRLFPCWTELYGTSNPHPIAGDRYLWACLGTLGRDHGWQAGVTFSDAEGSRFESPVVIAAEPDREFGDIDVVRLADGRFLAVIREFLTKESVWSSSADEGRSWTPIRPTGFKGANIKLLRLRSGAVLCAYRDEDPARRGVSCSVSEDGGETWRFAGQLYAAEPDLVPRVGSPCGYPDMVYLDEREILCVLHTYPDATGQVHLQLLRLEDRSKR